VTSAAGPVIPNFGHASKCVVDNDLFCWDWVRGNWGSTLQPALVDHVELTLIAVAIGFLIAFAAALLAHRQRWLEPPFAYFSAFLYTIPSVALFQLLVPITGITRTSVEIALVGYTLLILFRNILVGLRSVPEDVLEAARGMGLDRLQILLRVELPLALPAIVAGLRIAVVTTVSLATIASVILPQGLGYPVLTALRSPQIFKTEIIAAGLLVVALAIAADVLLVVAQRVLTPWARKPSPA
jgi:osmoprotectant transport system permease protein